MKAPKTSPKVSQTRQQTVITEVWTIDTGQQVDENAEFMVIDKTGQTLTVLDRSKVEINIDHASFSEGCTVLTARRSSLIFVVRKNYWTEGRTSTFNGIVFRERLQWTQPLL